MEPGINAPVFTCSMYTRYRRSTLQLEHLSSPINQRKFRWVTLAAALHIEHLSRGRSEPVECARRAERVRAHVGKVQPVAVLQLGQLHILQHSVEAVAGRPKHHAALELGETAIGFACHLKRERAYYRMVVHHAVHVPIETVTNPVLVHLLHRSFAARAAVVAAHAAHTFAEDVGNEGGRVLREEAPRLRDQTHVTLREELFQCRVQARRDRRELLLPLGRAASRETAAHVQRIHLEAVALSELEHLARRPHRAVERLRVRGSAAHVEGDAHHV
eukprot:scaffold5061_cov378-Prasinococcus_capsulatus_cf.AAC.16